MTTPSAPPAHRPASGREWGSGGLKTTIEDVARAAKVSRQTVTNTLNYPDRVRPETRQRVRAEIERLGYRPSSAARSLRSRASGAVGVELRMLGPDYHNGLMGPFLAELSRAAGRQGAHVVTFGQAAEESSPEAYAQMWLTRRVDAFVLTDTMRGDPRPGWLREHGAPFVSFGRVWDDPSFTRWVDVDGAAGTRLAVDHCHARGYDAVGYLGWHPGRSPVMDSRRDGWATACGDRGLPVTGLAGVCDDDLDSVTRAAGDLLDAMTGATGPAAPVIRTSTGASSGADRRPAVVCATDLIAVGVHHALAQRGLRVGADVGLVGFDNSETARLHGLTSIRQPLPEVADRLLELLEDCFRHQPPPELGGLLLAPSVHERGSTAPAAAG